MFGTGYPRVMFITEKSGIGGGETSLLALLRVMKEHGKEPILLCPPGKLASAARRTGLRVYTIKLPDVHLWAGIFPSFSARTVARLWKTIKEEKVHILHAESALGVLYGGMAAGLARVPCVATYHGFWPLSSRAFCIFLTIFCKAVYPVSNSVARQLEDCVRTRRTRVKTVPLAVDGTFLQQMPDKQAARQILGLPRERPIVLQVARFQEIKGQMNLLKAMEILLQSGDRMAPLAVFVGGVMEPASPEVLEYRDRVMQKGREPHLRNHVLFLGERDDVALLMRAADVVVCPSDYESFGMAIIEAMAVGTPVVATSSGGPACILEDRVTGVLVPPGDPVALAEGIRAVLYDKRLAVRLAARARGLVVTRYSPEGRYSRMIGEYLRLLP